MQNPRGPIVLESIGLAGLYGIGNPPMSPHAIHLRSDSPALLVEFNLPPGTHARIGVSPTAEISLPLAGLAPIAGVIGRTPEGRIYHADPDGENLRHIELPAALSLPPFHFVVFQPVDKASPPPAKTALLQQSKKKLPRQTVFALAAVALAVAITAALIATNQSAAPQPTKPGAIPALASTTETAPPTTKAGDPAPPPQTSEVSPALAKATHDPASPPAVLLVAPTKEGPAPPAKLDLEALAQRVAPAVFRLEVKDESGNLTGTGTAFAISADGLAVTNFHVVDGGKSFTARTTQGAEFAVSGVTATDPAADLALIHLSASSLEFLELGESDSLHIGAPVAVFGAPRGLSGTLSDGILSARRTGEDDTEKNPTNGGKLLQITAPVSSGSSGSPVFDSRGKVIGVAVSILPGPTSQNLNFAVPVEAVTTLQKNAAAGLAETARHLIPENGPTQPKTKSGPDDAFFADPDYGKLRGHFLASDWIQCVRVARPLAANHPNSSKAQAWLGFSLGGIGLHSQAETALKNSLAIDPENGAVWGKLGTMQAAQKNTENARQSWKRGAGLAPESAWIWAALSISFLNANDHLEAISPMENLRKLDRPEFDRLIGIARSLRVHPPDLQAMLHHFDNLEEPEIAAAAPTKPEDLAASLVATFLRHGVAADVQAELADYAATVNPYFDQGAQQRPAILKDINTYRAGWPRRSLELVAVESARRDDLNTLEATYRLRYSASNGKTTRSGTLIQGIRYTLTGKRWLVSGIQTIERVVE